MKRAELRVTAYDFLPSKRKCCVMADRVVMSDHHNTTLNFTEQKTIGSDTHFCSLDDGCKDARNMLRNNWLPINQYLLHLVGLAFICLYKMHGHSNIKIIFTYFQNMWYAPLFVLRNIFLGASVCEWDIGLLHGYTSL